MPKESTLISVIIPLYNGAALINRCLDSVFSQKGKFKIEVVVIDDGSTDNSVDIIKNYTNPIKLIQQTNKGAASARNRGIKIASGKYLAFLDADDYWLPNFLLRTTTFLEQNKNVIAVSTAQIHKIPGKKDFISPSFISESSKYKSDVIILDRFYDFWGTHKHICTGSVLLKTQIVKKTGGQLEELRISQDLEFWSFLGTFGKWGFIPEISFVSDGGEVTKHRGWLKKNTIRWKSTPSMETFSKRTLSRLEQQHKSGFKMVSGWVAYNFTYGHVMAKDFKKAYRNVLQFGDTFPKSKGSAIFKISARFGKVGFAMIMYSFRLLQITRYFVFNLL